jgi:CHAD domain-containing protein
MIEHELKFALTPSIAAEFEQRATLGLAKPSARLRSRYFDTAAGDLMQASVSLRVRRTPEGFVQTIKASGGGAFERYEWERPVPAELPDFDALPPADHPAGALTRDCFALLAPVFETDFERQVRLVRPQPGVTLELACDRGEIRAGARSERIAEVELERKEGAAAAFYHYAMQWARLHHAQLVLPSKGRRGLQLAGLAPDRPRPVELPPKSPPPDLPVPAVARQILGSHLEHILGNVEPIGAGNEAGGIRQLRIALRRFRAAIRFLDLRRPQDEAVGSPDGDDGSATWRQLDRQARWLAQVACRVVDADVLETGMLESLGPAFPADPSLRLLGRSLAIRRERERARLRAALASSEFASFVIQALAAIESLPPGRWQVASFGGFAAERLPALARRLRRRTRRAASERQWQGVRMAIGDLRHALQTCRETRGLAATAPPVDDAVAALGRWQYRLGVARSMATARSRAAQALAATAAPAEVTTRAAALVDGYGAGAIQRARHQQLREPILALAGQLLAASEGTPARGRQGQAAATAAVPAPPPAADARAEPSAEANGDARADGRSGYHPGSPPARVPDAR